MKRVKSIAMWLVVLMMVCSLMGCAKEPEPTPQEIYAAAYEKINSLSGMDAEMTMDIAMTAEGETMDLGMDVDLLMEKPNSEDMKMSMGMKMEMLGIGIDVQAYYSDGYYLMDMMGQKIKYQMPMEDAMDQSAMMQEVAVEALSEITMTEEDGLRILTFSVDPEKLMGDFMEGYMADMGLGNTSENLEYKTFQGVMKVNEEGYPVDITMELAYTTKTEGILMDCEATITVIYNDPGQPVTVEIPDMSEYIEVDPEDM